MTRSARLAHHAEHLFAEGGPLARRVENYELRKEQRELTRAVAKAIEEGKNLLAEAGTGTGKTLAYLAPLLLAQRRAVVSTATKALQQQLLEHDVPLLAAALGAPVSARLMKGRGNYLCLTRARLEFSQPHLKGLANEEEIARLAAFAEHTETGDRAEVKELADDSAVWPRLASVGDECRGRACADFDRCFVTRMRRAAADADIIVVNHHLYFSEMAIRARAADANVALLPAHELVVFDEAHELEEVVAQHFGVEVSEQRVLALGRDLTRLPGVGRELRHELRQRAAAIIEASHRLFTLFPQAQGRHALERDFTDSQTRAFMEELAAKLHKAASLLTDLACEDAPTLARRAELLACDLGLLVDCDCSPAYAQPFFDDEPSHSEAKKSTTPWVRYSESTGRRRAVVIRPLDVSTLISEPLAAKVAVFVSATLSLNGSFAFFRDRLGLAGCDEVRVDSPFDYHRQVVTYIPTSLPDPTCEDFTAAAVLCTRELLTAAGGGAFVLCTSHRMLGAMREASLDTGLLTLTQGEAPKERLIERFRAAGDAVLCATMSFWQGIDVPGRALRLVVIDRLPFASPADPLLAARLAWLCEQGRDPFRDYQLPHAALLLRQGFGRLIRHREDRGMVAILDRRLASRAYGRLLMASLPSCPRITRQEEALAMLASLAPPEEPADKAAARLALTQVEQP